MSNIEWFGLEQIPQDPAERQVNKDRMIAEIREILDSLDAVISYRKGNWDKLLDDLADISEKIEEPNPNYMSVLLSYMFLKRLFLWLKQFPEPRPEMTASKVTIGTTECYRINHPTFSMFCWAFSLYNDAASSGDTVLIPANKIPENQRKALDQKVENTTNETLDEQKKKDEFVRNSQLLKRR